MSETQTGVRVQLAHEGVANAATGLPVLDHLIGELARTARFKLSRRDSVVASGPFTLVLQRQGDRWRILHDHTSADTK